MRKFLLMLGAVATFAGGTAWQLAAEERYYICSKPELPPFAVPEKDVNGEQARGYRCREAGP
jgi:hypothetical protein